MHHAPDFQLWADRLPGHWRVIILAVSPMTAFDDDAALNLAATARQLASRGRRLILSGVTPRQYKILFRNGLGNVLDAEDVSPDLEFAVARALHTIQLIDSEPRES
jgi:anti-anti-sigma regulatory factor